MTGRRVRAVDAAAVSGTANQTTKEISLSPLNPNSQPNLNLSVRKDRGGPWLRHKKQYRQTEGGTEGGRARPRLSNCRCSSASLPSYTSLQSAAVTQARLQQILCCRLRHALTLLSCTATNPMPAGHRGRIPSAAGQGSRVRGDGRGPAPAAAHGAVPTRARVSG